jgi:hypothetical protein
MRTFVKIFIVFITSLLISSCAGGMIQLPQKYALDGQLEQVTSIYKSGIMDWETVDNQSLIIETGPSNYYLLVLKIPSPELVFRNRIRISSTGSMIRSGLDEVIIFDSAHMKSSYPIDRIYRIKGSEQMRAIRDQLTGKTDTRQKDNKTGSSVKPRLLNDEGAKI